MIKFVFKPHIRKARDGTKISGVISRKCIALVVKQDDVWRARIDITLEDSSPLYVEMDFTERSLDYSNHIELFSKYNLPGDSKKYIWIRQQNWTFQGNDTERFDIFREGVIITGYIRLIGNKEYFDYNELIGYSQNRIFKIPKIDINKPVYHKGYGNNR